MRERKWILTAAAVLFIIALILRVWGTNFGLPFIYHSDEPHEVYRALRLGTGSFDFSVYRAMKGGYFYILFMEYGLYYIACRATGSVSDPVEFARNFAGDPSDVWLLSRVTTAVFGAGTVVLLMFLGLRVFPGSPAGVFAAAFLAFSMRHIVDSHYVTVDVPMTFFLVLGFILLHRMMDRGGWKDYLMAALVLSFTLQFKIILGGVLLSFIAAHLLGMSKPFEPTKRRNIRFLTAFSTGAILYLVGNPGVLVNAREIVSYFLGSFKGGAAPRGFDVTMGYRDYLGFRLYLRSLVTGSGILITILALVGLMKSVFRNDRFNVVILLFLVPTGFVLFASRTVAAPRYLIPLLPFLFLYAGWLTDSILSGVLKSIDGGRKVEVIVVAVFIAILAGSMAPPIARAFRFDRDCTLPDTRTLAREWIIRNLPPGSRIALAGHETFPASGTVQLPLSESFLERRAVELEKKDPGRARFLKEFALPSANDKRGSFIPVYFDTSDSRFDTDSVWRKKPRYFVTSDVISRQFLTGKGRVHNPGFAGFYDRIARYRLLHEEKPVSGKIAGPVIRVYSVEY